MKIGSAINLIWFGCSRNIVEVQCRISLYGEYLLALADVRHFVHLNSTPQSCHFTKICKMSVCFREMGRLPTNSVLMIVLNIICTEIGETSQLRTLHWSISQLDIFVLPWLNLYLASEDLQRSVSHLWCGSMNNMFNVLNIKNVASIFNVIFRYCVSPPLCSNIFAPRGLHRSTENRYFQSTFLNTRPWPAFGWPGPRHRMDRRVLSGDPSAKTLVTGGPQMTF